MAGRIVEAVRPGLSDGGEIFFVVVPWGGLRMLSAALLLASAAALFLQLTWGRTVLLIAAGIFLALLGNGLRAAVLYLLKTWFSLGDTLHTMSGLVLYAAGATLLVWLARTLKKGVTRPTSGDGAQKSALTGAAPLRLAGNIVLILAALAAAVAPLPFASHAPGHLEIPSRVSWPESWEGHALKEKPLDAEWLEDFPGRIAEFQLGESNRRVVFRWTPVVTRMLHPAETCYIAHGAEVSPLPAHRDRFGHLWSAFRVTRHDGRQTAMRQCYFTIPLDSAGGALEDWIREAPSWPDASSWYWAAALPGSDVEATLAVTLSDG